MLCAPQDFSWLRRIGQSSLSTTLLGAMAGAFLGVVASKVRDWWKDKETRNAFKSAVGKELDELDKELEEWFAGIDQEITLLEGRKASGPQYVAHLRTGVYATQVGKLPAVDDPIILKVIHFYSDVSVVEEVIKGVNDTSARYTYAEPWAGLKDAERPRLLSSMRVLKERIQLVRRQLKELRPQLP